MNVKTEHKDEKAHNHVKDGGEENTGHTPFSGAGLQVWQKQYYAQQELDAAQNGEDVHKVSFFQSLDLITIHIKSQRRRK